jgi:hypothetical protein
VTEDVVTSEVRFTAAARREMQVRAEAFRASLHYSPLEKSVPDRGRRVISRGYDDVIESSNAIMEHSPDIPLGRTPSTRTPFVPPKKPMPKAPTACQDFEFGLSAVRNRSARHGPALSAATSGSLRASRSSSIVYQHADAARANKAWRRPQRGDEPEQLEPPEPDLATYAHEPENNNRGNVSSIVMSQCPEPEAPPRAPSFGRRSPLKKTAPTTYYARVDGGRQSAIIYGHPDESKKNEKRKPKPKPKAHATNVSQWTDDGDHAFDVGAAEPPMHASYMERVSKGRSAIVHRHSDEYTDVMSTLAYAISTEPEHSNSWGRPMVVGAARPKYKHSAGAAR